MISGKDLKHVRVSNAVAAGTTDVECTAVDMQGFDWVEFIVLFGTITGSAVTSIKAQQGAASNGSDAADITGNSVTVADDDDNQIAICSVVKPTSRYVRCVVDRGTQNAVVDGVVAILGRGIKQPATQDATTVVGLTETTG